MDTSAHQDGDSTLFPYDSLQIQAIGIELKEPSDYPVQLKLVVDGETKFKPQAIATRQAHWTIEPSIDVGRNSIIVVTVNKQRRIWTTKLATITAPFKDVSHLGADASDAQRELIFPRKRCTLTLKFRPVILNLDGKQTPLDSPAELNVDDQMQREESEPAQDTLDRALVTAERHTSLLDELGRARCAVETIVRIAICIGEVHPFAKAASLALTTVFTHLRKEEEYDENICKLARAMGNTLSFIYIAGELAKIEKLKLLVGQIMEVVKRASHFMIDHLSRRRLNRALSSTISSSATSQIEEFIDTFKELRAAFDSGVVVQLLDLFCSAEEERFLTDLRRVIPIRCRPGYDPTRVCMPGTRVDVLEIIDDWAMDPDSSERLLWLHGIAGVGKSSIASSVCHRLKERVDGRQCLGASFFCKRDDKHLRDPALILPRIVTDLSNAYPTFGKAVAAALSKTPTLATDAMMLQFKGLIKEPLTKLAKSGQGPLVVVIDALDECGAAEDRRRLISIFREMSGLTQWLKIVVTSRRDNDIKNAFAEAGNAFFQIDLNEQNNSNDILTFVRKRMEDIATSKGLPATWPGEEKMRDLAQRGTPLFIWVEVAATFIQSGKKPNSRLDRVLEANSSGGEYAQLDVLYTAAIEDSFGYEEDNAEVFRDVVGTIVAVSMHRPLPRSALKGLMTSDLVEDSTFNDTIDGLGSVLYEDINDDFAIRFCHPSFMDFLTSPGRSCPTRFHIDLAQQNTRLAIRCLRTMLDGPHRLKFNICELRSSYCINQDIVDLAERVKHAISDALRYSCLHWTSHLGDALRHGESRTVLYNLLISFFAGPCPLYWLEALSLLGDLKAAIAGLPLVIAWIQNPKDEYSCYAADIYRFVLAFYDPISRSAPHIYVSALPFAPKESIIAQRLLPLFPNVLTFTRGQQRHWSACLRTFDGHSGSVWSVAVSHDGRRVASASNDNTIRIWDVESGTLLVPPLEGHTDGIRSVAFSSDGRWIASGSKDKTIRLWNAETGAAVLKPLTGHTDNVKSVAFSPDRRQIASGSVDGTILVWNTETGVVIKPLHGHGSSVLCVAFSPVSRHIVSGSKDMTIRVWEVATGMTVIEPLRGHTDIVTSVTFSPDGQRVLSASWDKTIRVWDAVTGATLFEPLTGHTGKIWSVAWSPDGQQIVSSSGDQTIRIWEMESDISVVVPLIGHHGTVRSVSFLPDSRQVVSGSSDKTIRIWDATPRTTYHSQGHRDAIWAVAFSPNGQHMVSGSEDKSLRLWDVESGAEVSNPFEGHNGPVFSVAFSEDGQQIVSGSADKTVCIWDVQNCILAVGPLEGHDDVVSSVAFSADSQCVASGSLDGNIRIWDADSGSVIRLLEESGGAIWAIAFSPDGGEVVSGSDDNKVRIWDAETGTVVIGPLEGHSKSVSSVAFSPDNRHVASGSLDNSVRVWDVEVGGVVELHGHHDGVLSVAFSQDGKQIVSGSEDKTIRIWDVKTGEVVVGPLEGHTNSVSSVAFSPDSRLVISGSSDKSIRIWVAESVAAGTSTLQRHSYDAGSLVTPLDNQEDIGTPSSPSVSISARAVVPAMRLPSANPSLQFMNNYGWVTQADDVLLWVPAEYRQRFVESSSMVIPGFTSLDFAYLRHGESWVDVLG